MSKRKTRVSERGNSDALTSKSPPGYSWRKRLLQDFSAQESPCEQAMSALTVYLFETGRADSTRVCFLLMFSRSMGSSCLTGPVQDEAEAERQSLLGQQEASGSPVASCSMLSFD